MWTMPASRTRVITGTVRSTGTLAVVSTYRCIRVVTMEIGTVCLVRAGCFTVACFELLFSLDKHTECPWLQCVCAQSWCVTHVSLHWQQWDEEEQTEV